MLQRGAREVYAIDVGYGQLDWGLRNDERVHVMERTNARYMEPDWFNEPLQFASIDVSFISLSKILPPLWDCLAGDAQVVALIKPQFEAGRDKVGKHGVVSDPLVHVEVCRSALAFARQAGYLACGLSFSPIRGPKGNIEFLLWLSKNKDMEHLVVDEKKIQDVVEEAHNFCISN